MNQSAFITTQILLATALSIGSPCMALAQTCYDVGGTLDTINLSPINQEGNIHLITYKQHTGDIQFDRTGTITGTVTGTDGIGSTTLSHRASFSSGKNGSGFSTEMDQATIVGVISTCAFNVHEKITKVINGSGNFNNVTSAEIYGDGVVSYCPDDNHNHFELTGWFCTK
ncbi:MAG: hypothetical protein ACXV7J_06810 [Methylomonas sp.]